MFANYVLAALRALQRQKLFSLLNVFGLAIGLCACMIIILFVRHEFSYDTQFADLDRLYRIEATAKIPGQQSTATPNFFGTTYDLLPADYEEIELIGRLQGRGGTVINAERSTAETFSYADPEFLRMFNFPVLEGDLENALSQPTDIVLTREMAVKHLGPGPWLGRTLQINQTIEREMKVAAVIETLPGNTHFAIDILVPIDQRVYDATAFAGTTDLQRWNGLPFNVYIKLKPGRSIEPMRATINDWVDRYFPAQIQALVGINGSQLFAPRIMPVRDIHMRSPVVFDMKPPGNMATVYGFGGIALMILLIACINFMNMATATSTLRAKEVAVRKVMGATRAQLFVQFQLEALVTAVVALFIAMVAMELILPVFADYTQRDITTALMFDPMVLAAILSLTVVVGLGAGLHPALVLSSFRPARVLQSNKSSIAGNSWLRSSLVLFQFAVSAALIISTLLIYVQTEYARNVDMGYDNDLELTIAGLGQEAIVDSVEALREEVLRMPGVTEASLTSFTPGDARGTGLSVRAPGADERVIIFYRSVYPEFFAQFDVQPLAGRLLSHEFSNDRVEFISDPNSVETQMANVVINEAAAKTLGFATPQDAIGQVYYRGQQNQIVSTIVGVVPNIHFGSPRTEFDGEIYMYVPAEVNNMLVSYQTGRFTEVRQNIEAKMLDLYPRQQTQVQHLQDNIAQQYAEEAIQSRLLATFSGLAILVACMGLFGLASFTINRRTKEIGVRKVMGASSKEIVVLLLTQFSRPVLMANVLVWPLCWYAVDRWLAEFNHQIELLPWFVGTVVVAVLVTVLLAWMTVGSHAWRVARTNPVYALRYE